MFFFLALNAFGWLFLCVNVNDQIFFLIKYFCNAILRVHKQAIFISAGQFCGRTLRFLYIFSIVYSEEICRNEKKKQVVILSELYLK